MSEAEQKKTSLKRAFIAIGFSVVTLLFTQFLFVQSRIAVLENELRSLDLKVEIARKKAKRDAETAEFAMETLQFYNAKLDAENVVETVVVKLQPENAFPFTYRELNLQLAQASDADLQAIVDKLTTRRSGSSMKERMARSSVCRFFGRFAELYPKRTEAIAPKVIPWLVGQVDSDISYEVGKVLPAYGLTVKEAKAMAKQKNAEDARNRATYLGPVLTVMLSPPVDTRPIAFWLDLHAKEIADDFGRSYRWTTR